MAPYNPLAGHVTFYGTDQRSARETVSWEVGQLVIATTKLTLSSGSAPKPFVTAAARDY